MCKTEAQDVAEGIFGFRQLPLQVPMEVFFDIRLYKQHVSLRYFNDDQPAFRMDSYLAFTHENPKSGMKALQTY